MIQPDYSSEEDFDDYDFNDDYVESDLSASESGYDEPSNPTVSIEATLPQLLQDYMKTNSLPKVHELVAMIENYEKFILSNGWKPLAYAAYLGKPELVEYFINYEENSNIKSISNDLPAPLTLACSVLNENIDEDHLACVKLLLDDGVDINYKDRYGVTALMTACKSSTLSTVELLLSRGADVNSSDNDGWSPLFYAVNRGEIDIIQAVLKFQADVDKLDKRDRYAYDIATDKGFTQIAELVKPNKVTASEEAALQYVSLQRVFQENSVFDHEQYYYNEVFDMVASAATGMDRYLNVFFENKISLRELLLFKSEEKLKKIGVLFSVHRLTLIERIKQFHLGSWYSQSLGLCQKTKEESQPSQLMITLTFVATVHRQVYVLRTTLQYLQEDILKFSDDNSSLELLKKIKINLQQIKTRLIMLREYMRKISDSSKPYLLAQEIV